jgi:teichuronic acid biosynthesis glycosyltransferase TuaG
MEKPLISIVTPIYNTELYLEDCLNSVLSQTYQNWEMILIDDCSTDSSVSIAEQFSKKDSRFKLLRNSENKGSGITRNSGIDFAKGKYLCFLDSDDRWKPNKLEIQVNFMLDHDYSFSFGSYEFIDEKNNLIKRPKIVTEEPIDYEFLLKKTEIFTSTVMLDLDKIGKFMMPPHRRKQDYGLWLKILKSGVKAYGIKEPIAQYRLRKGSATSNKLSLITKHVLFLKETQKFSFAKSVYYTGYWAFNGFIKYYT